MNLNYIFCKISGSDVLYPYDIKQYISENLSPSSSYSFDDESIESLASHSIYIVKETPQPSYSYTQSIDEGTPILSGSYYYQTWNITTNTSEVQEDVNNLKLEQIRQTRNLLLIESDWTQFQDSPITGSKLTEWQTYRQDLRDITETSNPFEITWPTKPE